MCGYWAQCYTCGRLSHSSSDAWVVLSWDYLVVSLRRVSRELATDIWHVCSLSKETYSSVSWGLCSTSAWYIVAELQWCLLLVHNFSHWTSDFNDNSREVSTWSCFKRKGSSFVIKWFWARGALAFFFSLKSKLLQVSSILAQSSVVM